MKNITNAIILTTLIGYSSHTIANDIIPGAGLSAVISQISTRSSGYHTIFLQSITFPNTDSCTFDDKSGINENESAGNKSIYASLTAAFLTKTPVLLETSGCLSTTGTSANTASKIIRVKLVMAP